MGSNNKAVFSNLYTSFLADVTSIPEGGKLVLVVLARCLSALLSAAWWVNEGGSSPSLCESVSEKRHTGHRQRYHPLSLVCQPTAEGAGTEGPGPRRHKHCRGQVRCPWGASAAGRRPRGDEEGTGGQAQGSGSSCHSPARS